MSAIRLIAFECRKQAKSLTFLLIMVVVSVFALSQFTELFHLPVRNEQDIQALNRSGERDFIWMDNSEAELAEKSIQYLRLRLADGSISHALEAEVNDLIGLLDETQDFDAVLRRVQRMQGGERLFPWLLSCQTQFSQRLGSVDEINQMLRASLGNTGYSPIFYRRYVTYMQILLSLVLFPLFIFLCTRDDHHNMTESIVVQPISPRRYLLSRYWGALIPLVGLLYLLGLALNGLSAIRFLRAGHAFRYTAFLPSFLLDVVPCIFFFSALLMLLMLLVKKVTAVFPLYAAFVLLNVTPGIFKAGGNWFRRLSPILRLDGPALDAETVLVNRAAYCVIGIICLAFPCKLYERMRQDLEKRITL